MNKPRFSMLLLEPGEIYFEDYSCTLHDSCDIEGRLKVCSKSLVFEPKSWSNPLIKMQYRDIKSIDIPAKNPFDSEDKFLQVETKTYAEMLEGNIIAPYKFKYELKEFLFEFDFTTAESCISFIEQLKRAASLHAAEQNVMIASISHSLYSRSKFDRTTMDDYTETIDLELSAERITPLVRNPGIAVLTHTTLYFQPYNYVESSPVIKLKLVNIRRIYKRRFLLRQIGLEIYFKQNTTLPHIYLSFKCEEDRNLFFDTLNSSENLELERIHFEEMSVQWQNGIVSNYDYLVYLNCLADRSKNDLSQYPVFPWVISDFTSEKLDLNDASVFRDLSKPIGALNPKRLAKLKERYEEMTEHTFLYGSHYSAPGLVLFYLVRKYPHYMLCLQNGRFDHPDRMFNSVADVYKNCLNNMADFKELIPEFYDTDSGEDIFTNSLGIDFGVRGDGSRVDAVKLPPWAKNAEQFVRLLRLALESEFVSRHLHLWIDLIFGYKQRGEAAVKANNLFHYVSYEGSVDLDSIQDMNERHALEVQIMEFGQVPKQLFLRPHPRRIMNHIVEADRLHFGLPIQLEIFDNVRIHKEAVMDLAVINDTVVSVGKDGAIKVYSIEQKTQLRGSTMSNMPLSCCAVISDVVVVVGSWDNHIYVYDIQNARILGSFRAHEDSISCILWLNEDKKLISGGSDCVVRVWDNIHEDGVDNAIRGLKAEFDHDGNVIGVDYCKATKELISVTNNGMVYKWDISNKTLVMSLRVHSGSIQAYTLLNADRIVIATEKDEICVTDLGLDHCILRKSLQESISVIRWDSLSRLWLCGEYGTIYQWDLNTFTEVNSTKTEHAKITALYLDSSEGMMFTSGVDGTIKIWKLKTRDS